MLLGAQSKAGGNPLARDQESTLLAVVQAVPDPRTARGKRTLKISDALTSVTCEEARAMKLERVWCGYWTIENRKQYVRDVTMGEDQHHMQRGQAPQVLAARRNARIDVWRSYGWSTSAAALRHTAAAVQRA